MDAPCQKDNRKRDRKGFLARFAHDRRGVTAIEFGLLAIPFFALVFAILESCISFASQELMVNATDNVARQLRTGQIKKGDVTEGMVEQKICDQMGILAAGDCLDRIEVDLRNFTTFKDASYLGFWITKVDGEDDVELTKSGQRDAKQFVSEPGLSMSKNMLRVFYKWPVLTDYMALWMSNMNGTDTLHYASAVWQNEPFND